MQEDTHLTVVVLGASGDLAKKKTYPALFELYKAEFLPKVVRIVGYARSDLTDNDLRDKLRGYLKADESVVNDFLSKCSYVSGQYDGFVDSKGYTALQQKLTAFEAGHPGCCGRLFYLALPPKVYPEVCKGIREHVRDMSSCKGQSWLRLIVEKPFGTDLESSNVLAEKLGGLWPEEQLYRIDHYLGKELVQNMMFMRFTNMFLAGESGCGPCRPPACGSLHRLTSVHARDVQACGATSSSTTCRSPSRSRLGRTAGAATLTAWASSATSSRTTCCRCWRS